MAPGIASNMQHSRDFTLERHGVLNDEQLLRPLCRAPQRFYIYAGGSERESTQERPSSGSVS